MESHQPMETSDLPAHQDTPEESAKKALDELVRLSQDAGMEF